MEFLNTKFKFEIQPVYCLILYTQIRDVTGMKEIAFRLWAIDYFLNQRFTQVNVCVIFIFIEFLKSLVSFEF